MCEEQRLADADQRRESATKYDKQEKNRKSAAKSETVRNISEFFFFEDH